LKNPHSHWTCPKHRSQVALLPNPTASSTMFSSWFDHTIKAT